MSIEGIAQDATEVVPDGKIHEIGDVRITEGEISDPEAFLATDRGREWFDGLMRNVYFTAYYRDRSDSIDKKTAQRIAERVLTAKYAGSGECVEELLTDVFGHGAYAEDDYHESGYASDHEEKIRELAVDIQDHASENGIELPELDEDAWQEAVRDKAVEEMYEKDDSSILDMIDHHERFQMVVRFTDADDTIYSNKAWAEWSDLAIDKNMQSVFARLGHTVAEYRMHSGNRNSSSLRRGLPKRRPAIASLDQIKDVVTEACSSYFSLVLFAYVPLRDILDLDVTKPIMLSDCSIASYNSGSGTFYDVELEHAVEILPGHGWVEAPTGYTPDDVCGLVLSAYDADMANVVDDVPPKTVDDQDELPLAA